MFTHPPPTTTFPFRFSAAIGVVSSPKLSVVSMSDGAADVSSVPPLSKTVRVEIKGRVQGVFFRYWTVENARELGLRGWVRNRRDGFVEAVFSGDPASVQDMVDRRCRVGPPAAAVTGIASFPWVEDPGQGFKCKPTV